MIRFEYQCGVGIVLVGLSLVAAHVQGQSAHRCADGKKLTLAVVEGYVTRKQDAIAIARIEGCHVGFSLDAMALQRLAHAGISEAVFQALDLDTVTHMTAEQAHAEVAALDGKPADAETQKAFQARIQFLKQAEYVVTEPFTYIGYDPTFKLMRGKIGAEEYAFRPVTETENQTLGLSPKGLVVVRSYDEDEMETRVVRVASAHVQVKGESLKAQVKKLVASSLVEMHESMKQGDALWARHDQTALAFYLQANEKASEILHNWDTDNQEAKDCQKRVAALTVTIAEEAGQAEKCKKNGMYCESPGDPKGLMWQLKDNGSDIEGPAAAAYCKAQRDGGYSDWRLPVVMELQALFDSSVSADTPPSAGAMLMRRNGVIQRLPKGTVWQYHIKGGIALTATGVWTATDDDASDGSKWAYVDFQDGNGYRRNAKDKLMLRALCVRGSAPMAVHAADPTVAGGDHKQIKVLPAGPGVALTDADKLERQGEALYVQKQFKDAFPLADQSCTQGSQDGCGLEAAMLGLGVGTRRDMKRAVALAVQSCDAGSARGCEVVGSGYYLGYGLDKDQFRAAEYFEASCQAGFAIACFDSGMQTLDGAGVAKDVPKAVKLFHRACDGGFQKACGELMALRNRGIE